MTTATFQSLTRDSNHSNQIADFHDKLARGFNPSRGIAIIQTCLVARLLTERAVSIPHAG